MSYESFEAVRDSIVRSIEDARVYTEPFRYLELVDVLPPALYSELLTTPLDWEPSLRGPRTVYLLDRTGLVNFGLVREALCTTTVMVHWAIACKSSVGFAEPRVNVDVAGYSLRPHTDIDTKLGVLAIALCWDDVPEYGLRIGDKKLPFSPNSGYAFARSDDSVHAIDRVKSGKRVSIMSPVFKNKREPWQV